MYQPVYHRLPPLFRGRSRLIYPCGKAPNTEPQAGADAPQASPMKMALSDPDLWRAVLLRLGFPLPALPHARRGFDLVLYHTPNFYIWIVP